MIYKEAYYKAIRPIVKPSLMEFSANHVQLNKRVAAEAGRYNVNRVPYFKDIADALTDKETDIIVVMKPAQVGATQLVMNYIAYTILYDPAPMLYVCPTLDIAKKISKQRIQAMFDSMPILKGIIRDNRERDSGNTLFTKEYPNGILLIAGANSPSGLRSMPIRYLIADDIDAYPDSAGDEGSPLDLAMKRTTTYRNRKMIFISTPTNKSESAIEYWYNVSNQSKYYVPCPHCGKEQVLYFSNLKFEHNEDGKVTDAWYQCAYCNTRIDEKDKHTMLSNGKWVATNPKVKIKGYWLNGLYSEWLTWKEIATEFLRVKNNPVTLKTFVNTVLGEVWEDEAEKLEFSELAKRREHIEQIPSDCIVLTAGVDVQKDRIEVSVIGWGEGYTSWVIEHIIIMGDTTIEETYNDLESVLNKQYIGVNNNIYTITSAAIDTGYSTQAVYKFLKKHHSRRWYGIKGSSTSAQIISRPSRRNMMNVPVFYINVSMIKDIVYSRLSIDEGYGRVHFSDRLDDEYFMQLTAEQVKIRYKKGRKVREYVQVRERNEALDCMVYNTAALMILNPQLAMLKTRIQTQVKDTIPAESPQQPVQKRLPQRPNIKTRRGWMSL